MIPQQAPSEAKAMQNDAILTPGSNVWFTGSSQLVTSVIRAYVPEEERAAIGKDWREGRFNTGTITFDEADNIEASFTVSNLQVIGAPQRHANGLVCTPQMREFINLIDPGASAIIFMLRGNEYAKEALVDSNPGWDFSYGNRPALKGRQYVPAIDAMNHFKEILQSMIYTCLAFRQAFPETPIYHVPAPPPVESDKHVLANPEIFGALFEEFGLRPFEQRKKIYDAMYDYVGTQMNMMRIALLPPPPEALTPAGGLKAEYAHGCLHGNERYGRAIVAALRGE